MTATYEGKFGKIYEITDQRAKQAASLAGWLMLLPGAHPLWNWYLLNVIHLRDIEGMPPAVKAEVSHTHEIIVVALDPERGRPDPANAESWQHLVPVNHAVQFAASNDGDAIDLGYAVACALADGRLIAEPSGVRGARELMRAFVRQRSQEGKADG